MERFSEQRSKQIELQLTNTSQQLLNDVSHLAQISSAIKSNSVLTTSVYLAQYPEKYRAFQELKNYAVCTQLIDSIVYKQPSSENLLSTQQPVTYEDGIFLIASPGNEPVLFDPTPWLNSSIGQLVLVSGDTTSNLIYMPAGSSLDRVFFFYLLDTTYIQQIIKNIRSEEVPAIALFDENWQMATNINGSQLLPYVDSSNKQNGIYTVNDSTSICVRSGIANDFALIALISTDSISSQINVSFANSYLTLLALSGAGFFLALLGMRITYAPLNKLLKKVLPDINPKQRDLTQLESVFLKTSEQNQALHEKLEHYRISMQKSLLDSILTSTPSADYTNYPNIDQFFDIHSKKEIFVLQMMSPKKPLPYNNINAYFQEVLPGNDACQILEAKQNRAVFLINYTGTEPNKHDIIMELLNQLHEKSEYLAALSNSTDSPMDIPSLYENATYASSFWPETPVVDFLLLPSPPTTFTALCTYPYHKLDLLPNLLQENHFPQVHSLLDELFLIIDRSIQSENNLPDFFVCCILVDILTAIVNCMNRSNIKYEAYSDLYTETLFLCRSCPYQEKKDRIVSNTHQLIDFYQQELANTALTPAQVIQLMENNYSDPDFSITLLADKCQVSIAYMSYLIKKELNQNFSDYLWSLRSEKAKELLKDSELSIDEISVAVGYLNPTSFRRKFKQETGFTPSQFRTENKN